MRHGFLLSGAVLAAGFAGFVGCASGNSANLTGIGTGGSTSTGTTTTTGMGGTTSTTSTTSTSGTTSTTTTAMGGAGTGGMAGTGGGTGGSGPPPGFPLGADCTKDADCQSMLCKPVVIGTNPVCVIPCTTQADCGTGTAFFCESVTAGSANGYCIPHSPAHCLSCTADVDCGSLSEVCFKAPGDNTTACHIDCTLAGASACPQDYACTDQTVGGQARKLCRPKVIPTCLDSVGGFCDRLTIPQPCLRTNGAGSCIGERACLAGSKRFDKCSAASPQCKTDCSIQDPAGCTESYCPGATNTPANCGTCGNVCPGYQKPNDNVTCQGGTTCTFSCQGENYDVNNSQGDGCEAVDSPQGNHTQSAPANEGAVSCNDGNGHTVHFTGQLLSDKRVHETPAVVGFDTASGSAPDWYSINGTGGSFCQNDVTLTLSVQGSGSPTCYKLTVITDKHTYTCQTDATGNCGINQTVSQYSDGSTLLIEVQKTCGTNLIENVTTIVDGHL